MNDWLIGGLDGLLWVLASSFIFFIITVAISKLVGIRSFTRVSSFDFLITFAMGALLASTIIDNEISVAQGSVALLSLYSLQAMITYLRRHFAFFKRIVDNQPVLLMREGMMQEDNMKFARITEYELRAKLREHNVINYGQVLAAVLEVNGEVSVLTRSYPDEPFDPNMLRGVINKPGDGEGR
jgi:uncharacterized membrane protein YcaP (DUF421 family)